MQEVENKLIARDEILRTLKENLAVAQNRMKQQADKHHCERHFEEGDQVFLRLQPYKQTSLKDNHCQNIYPKFYGPYKVLLNVLGQWLTNWSSLATPRFIQSFMSPA